MWAVEKCFRSFVSDNCLDLHYLFLSSLYFFSFTTQQPSVFFFCFSLSFCFHALISLFLSPCFSTPLWSVSFLNTFYFSIFLCRSVLLGGTNSLCRSLFEFLSSSMLLWCLGLPLPFVLKIESCGSKGRWVLPLQVQAVPTNSWHGAQDITSGGHRAKDCNGNYLIELAELKFVLGIK